MIPKRWIRSPCFGFSSKRCSPFASCSKTPSMSMHTSRTYVYAYVQDYWRKRYVQYLLVREECSALSNHQEYLTESPKFLTLLRDYFGISAEQQATVDLDELGT